MIYSVASKMCLHRTYSDNILGIRGNAICGSFIVTTLLFSFGWYITWQCSLCQLFQSKSIILLISVNTSYSIDAFVQGYNNFIRW